ncbi:MAG: tetratricopeptide repeat protein [Vibrio sp.]
MKKYMSIVIFLVLQGCANLQNNAAFDSSLYSGNSIDNLPSAKPAQNEVEAIARGDKALMADKVDLALYEYIRSLGFKKREFADKTLMAIGDIHQSRGNLLLAEKAYLRATEVNSDNALAFEKLGVLYSRNKNIANGRMYFYRSVNADQIRLNNSHTTLFANNENGVTILDVERLKFDSASPIQTYIGLGILADVNNDMELAQAYYHIALAINPSSLLAKQNLGYSYYMQGNDKQALFYTRQVVEQQTDNKRAINNLALIYLRQGQENHALNVLNRVMPEYEALNTVGYLLMLDQKQQKAIDFFKQAINKNPAYYQIANDNLKRARVELEAKEMA